MRVDLRALSDTSFFRFLKTAGRVEECAEWVELLHSTVARCLDDGLHFQPDHHFCDPCTPVSAPTMPSKIAIDLRGRTLRGDGTSVAQVSREESRFVVA